MRVATFDAFRAMRGRLAAAIRRGRLAVIDVGTTKITCLVLRLDPEKLADASERDRLGTSLFGAMEVVGARMVQSRGIERGEIVDMDEAARAIRLALLNAERMAAPRIERVDHAIVSFSGGRPQSLSTTGEVETETGVVTTYDVAAALAAAPSPPIGPGRQVLHCQPVEIAVDHRGGVTDPRGMAGRHLSVAAHVLSVETRPLANLLECLRRCDLDCAGVVSAPYAAGLSALVEDEQKTGAVAIDLGGGGTSYSVFLRSHLICAGHVRMGGEIVTRDVSAGLETSRQTAEWMKRRYGGVVVTTADHRQPIAAPRVGEEDAPEPRHVSRGMLIGVMKPRVEEVLRTLRRELAEIGIADMPGCAVVLTGGAAQTPGIDDLATEILGRRPRIGRPLRVAGLPQALTGPDCAAAVGLATYALRPHDELWDFDLPRAPGARGRTAEVLRWLKTSW